MWTKKLLTALLALSLTATLGGVYGCSSARVVEDNDSDRPAYGRERDSDADVDVNIENEADDDDDDVDIEYNVDRDD